MDKEHPDKHQAGGNTHQEAWRWRISKDTAAALKRSQLKQEEWREAHQQKRHKTTATPTAVMKSCSELGARNWERRTRDGAPQPNTNKGNQLEPPRNQHGNDPIWTPRMTHSRAGEHTGEPRPLNLRTWTTNEELQRGEWHTVRSKRTMQVMRREEREAKDSSTYNMRGHTQTITPGTTQTHRKGPHPPHDTGHNPQVQAWQYITPHYHLNPPPPHLPIHGIAPQPPGPQYLKKPRAPPSNPPPPPGSLETPQSTPRLPTSPPPPPPQRTPPAPVSTVCTHNTWNPHTRNTPTLRQTTTHDDIWPIRDGSTNLGIPHKRVHQTVNTHNRSVLTPTPGANTIDKTSNPTRHEQLNAQPHRPPPLRLPPPPEFGTPENRSYTTHTYQADPTPPWRQKSEGHIGHTRVDHRNTPPLTLTKQITPHHNQTLNRHQRHADPTITTHAQWYPPAPPTLRRIDTKRPHTHMEPPHLHPNATPHQHPQTPQMTFKEVLLHHTTHMPEHYQATTHKRRETHTSTRGDTYDIHKHYTNPHTPPPPQQHTTNTATRRHDLRLLPPPTVRETHHLIPKPQTANLTPHPGRTLQRNTTVSSTHNPQTYHRRPAGTRTEREDRYITAHNTRGHTHGLRTPTTPPTPDLNTTVWAEETWETYQTKIMRALHAYGRQTTPAEWEKYIDKIRSAIRYNITHTPLTTIRPYAPPNRPTTAHETRQESKNMTARPHQPLPKPPNNPARPEAKTSGPHPTTDAQQAPHTNTYNNQGRTQDNRPRRETTNTPGNKHANMQKIGVDRDKQTPHQGGARTHQEQGNTHRDTAETTNHSIQTSTKKAPSHLTYKTTLKLAWIWKTKHTHNLIEDTDFHNRDNVNYYTNALVGPPMYLTADQQTQWRNELEEVKERCRKAILIPELERRANHWKRTRLDTHTTRKEMQEAIEDNIKEIWNIWTKKGLSNKQIEALIKAANLKKELTPPPPPPTPTETEKEVGTQQPHSESQAMTHPYTTRIDNPHTGDTAHTTTPPNTHVYRKDKIDKHNAQQTSTTHMTQGTPQDKQRQNQDKHTPHTQQDNRDGHTQEKTHEINTVAPSHQTTPSNTQPEQEDKGNRPTEGRTLPEREPQTTQRNQEQDNVDLSTDPKQAPNMEHLNTHTTEVTPQTPQKRETDTSTTNANKDIIPHKTQQRHVDTNITNTNKNEPPHTQENTHTAQTTGETPPTTRTQKAETEHTATEATNTQAHGTQRERYVLRPRTPISYTQASRTQNKKQDTRTPLTNKHDPEDNTNTNQSGATHNTHSVGRKEKRTQDTPSSDTTSKQPLIEVTQPPTTTQTQNAPHTHETPQKATTRKENMEERKGRNDNAAGQNSPGRQWYTTHVKRMIQIYTPPRTTNPPLPPDYTKVATERHQSKPHTDTITLDSQENDTPVASPTPHMDNPPHEPTVTQTPNPMTAQAPTQDKTSTQTRDTRRNTVGERRTPTPDPIARTTTLHGTLHNRPPTLRTDNPRTQVGGEEPIIIDTQTQEDRRRTRADTITIDTEEETYTIEDTDDERQSKPSNHQTDRDRQAQTADPRERRTPSRTELTSTSPPNNRNTPTQAETTNGPAQDIEHPDTHTTTPDASINREAPLVTHTTLEDTIDETIARLAQVDGRRTHGEGQETHTQVDREVEPRDRNRLRNLQRKYMRERNRINTGAPRRHRTPAPRREEPLNTVYDYTTKGLTTAEKQTLGLGKTFIITQNDIDIDRIKTDIATYIRRLRLHYMFREKGLDNTHHNIDINRRHRRIEKHRTPDDTQRIQWRAPKSLFQPEETQREINQIERRLENEIAAQIRQSKKGRLNIPWNWRTAIDTLKARVAQKEITITQADKGGGIIVLDYDEYIRKGTYYIETEAQAYEETQHPEKHIIATLTKERHRVTKQLKDTDTIPLDTATYATHQIIEKITGIKFYYKIHKTRDIHTMPVRPLQSCIGSPTQHLSQILTDIFKPYINNTYIPTYIRDTNHTLYELEGAHIEDTDTLTIADVVALYPSIEHEKGLKAIEEFTREHLHKDEDKIKAIVDAFKLVITENYVKWQGKIYKQTKGVAMGTPVAVTYANIYMNKIDRMTAEHCTYIKLHRRYIDDNLYIIPLDKKEEFTQTLNALNPPTLKFTVECLGTPPHLTALPFLDIKFYLNAERQIRTRLYTKETDKHQYLLPHSQHPRHIIRNIPYGVFARIRRLCTEDTTYTEDSAQAVDWLKERGYKENMLLQIREETKHKDRWEMIKKIEEQSRRQVDNTITDIPYINTYTAQTRKFGEAIKTQQREIDSIFQRAKVKTLNAFRRKPNLDDMIIQPALRIPIEGERKTPKTFSKCDKHMHNTTCPCAGDHDHTQCRLCAHIKQEDITVRTKITRPITCDSKNIIYMIWCGTCGMQYIGETQQKLRDRFMQHLHNMHTQDQDIYNHFRQPGHAPRHIKIGILETIQIDEPLYRKMRESTWIKELKTYTPHGLNTRVKDSPLDDLKEQTSRHNRNGQAP